MSAYIVDRDHIIYLAKAAMAANYFSWYYGKHNKADYYENFSNAVRIANSLWMENVNSVFHRYPDSVDDPEGAPGPIGEDYIITEEDLAFCFHRPFNPVQVLKACQCYAYQACEHEGWKTSEAKAFIDELTQAYIGKLPGYEDAKWGSPNYLITN